MQSVRKCRLIWLVDILSTATATHSLVRVSSSPAIPSRIHVCVCFAWILLDYWLALIYVIVALTFPWHTFLCIDFISHCDSHENRKLAIKLNGKNERKNIRKWQRPKQREREGEIVTCLLKYDIKFTMNIYVRWCGSDFMAHGVSFIIHLISSSKSGLQSVICLGVVFFRFACVYSTACRMTNRPHFTWKPI